MGSRRIETYSTFSEEVKQKTEGDNGGEKGSTSSSSVSSYGEFFRKMCGFYMSIGMTYHEYWHSEAGTHKYYLDAYEHKRKHEDQMLWLQGAYIYEALVNVHSIFNPMVKKPELVPYRDKPYSEVEKQKEEQEVSTERERQRKQSEKARDYMLTKMNRINNYMEAHSKK